jgi:hypothetical protein
MVIAIIAVVIVLALLLAGVGIVIFFVKRSKNSGAAASAGPMGQMPSAPSPGQTPSFGQPDPAAQPWQAQAPSWGAPADAQQPPAWGASVDAPQPQSWGNPADAQQPQSWGNPADAQPPPWGAAADASQAQSAWPSPADQPPTAPPDVTIAPPPPPEPNRGGTMPQDAYITTPSAGPGDAVPNPDLFMTTPSVNRQTGLEGPPASLRADDGSIIPLSRPIFRVGRHPECDIVIPTPGTSRQHAEFECREGAWLVTDLSSGNGTFVNGVRVRTQQLSPGDEVRIDQTRFTFNLG